MVNRTQKIFSNVEDLNSFDAIKISIASPERIRSWSYGEVKKSETINYRTFKPEKDGLFCARIFGPIKNYECLCGKYKRMKYRGVICEKCGVEVTLSKVRRERMGHIDLASPVAHVWFARSVPSTIATLLDIPNKGIKKILYFESYIVLDPGISDLTKYQLLSEDEYLDAQEKYGDDAFTAGIGAEAVKDLLAALDLKEEATKLKTAIKETESEFNKKKLIKRLKLVNAFLKSTNKPEWMILDCIPVLPPEFRPLVPLDAGRFASSDLNDLYRRVINRNNRLKRLMELNAPDIIIRNEKRMLQESVDALFDNGRGGKVITGTGNRPLKSLSDMLKGKQGRFRQNLLGKRVDYSGRSVIVVGPDLQLHQCGIPKLMALELFKPFVYSKLERYGIATTLTMAKRMVESHKPEVWDILEEVITQHPVLLNRAPTLHRLGIRAFEPVLVEGKAIKLHPLVCSAFNADFDGDQMAVHVPLSTEAQMEARVLMMATNNILSPASGKTVIDPSMDIVLGSYYLTMDIDQPEEGPLKVFTSDAEIDAAIDSGAVNLHTKIIFAYTQKLQDGTFKRLTYKTTIGRSIFSRCLPKSDKVSFDLVNKTLIKKDLSNIVNHIYRNCGQKETVIFSDRLKDMGFKYACRSGISFGKDDLVIPDQKQKIIDEAKKKVADFEQQYVDGLITTGEKYNKVVDTWTICIDKISNVMMEGMASKKTQDGLPNSVYIMAVSGARGSATQLRQIIGMRGLMARGTGEIIETPIVSNFKEGLSVLEYSIAAHGSRKGLTDVSLKTANSGYLTRRLVDVAQDVVITMEDCGTTKGLVFSDIIEGNELIARLKDRIKGRVLAEDLVNESTKELVACAGDLVTDELAETIETLGFSEVRVRSVLTCEAHRGVCAKCYGKDLSSDGLVNVGDTVGTIAAQSIGEPGTQLTLRTFHIGGAAQRGAEQYRIETPLDDLTVRFVDCKFVVNSEQKRVLMSRRAELHLINNFGRIKSRYKLPYGACVHVNDGDTLSKGSLVADWDPYTIPLISEKEGYVRFFDLIDGVSVKEILDEATGISTKAVIDWKQQSRNAELKPRIVLCDASGNVIKGNSGQEIRYLLKEDTLLKVNDGDKIAVGDFLAKLPRDVVKTRDITGGLPHVVDLFEARKPKDGCVMAEIDGHIEFGREYKGRRQLFLVADDGTKVEYFVPKTRSLSVQEGDHFSKGDIIVEGNVVPSDILRILGVESLASYLVGEVQSVYRIQGVTIDDKHIEVIVRQMLQKVEVTDPGDSDYLRGEIVDRREFAEECALIEGEKPKAELVLQGITKASLQTNSFISAASFQETTRVLTDAAIRGKVDHLLGLKENVTLGRLVPAGTGNMARLFKAEAAK